MIIGVSIRGARKTKTAWLCQLVTKDKAHRGEQAHKRSWENSHRVSQRRQAFVILVEDGGCVNPGQDAHADQQDGCQCIADQSVSAGEE
jgi:hypothetical protein